GAGMPVARVVVGGRASAEDWGKLAGMMRGRTVDPATELLVVPGSRQVLDTAARRGWTETLRTAGARVVEEGGWSVATARLRGPVLAKLRDHVATDDIVPWGARMLPHATEIAALSEHALEATEPGFAGRALSQRGGLLVAGSGLGGGERGEIAALVLAALGVRGVLARGF